MSRVNQLLQFRRYNRLNEEEWLRTLLDSIDGGTQLPMPSFPPQEYQSEFTGSFDEQAIREAWAFYIFMANKRKQYGLKLGIRTEVLDFGCGWGRFARMFLHDVPADNIWCADIKDSAIAMCQSTGVPGRLIKIDPMPPSELPSAQFDTAFAYSVFSHLSPIAHTAWKEEFARVTKPGALVFITIQARWFLDMCQELRDNPEQVTAQWYQHLSKAFVDHEDALVRYERGEFLYVRDPKAPMNPHYGDAVVPFSWIESTWSDVFELLEFVADRSLFEQSLVVMRRRA
jgi:SAM-dependent methyltransferase